MRNLTLAIEDDILRQARKLALDRDTTVNRLVRDYLRDLVEGGTRRNEARRRFMARAETETITIGPRDWTRDDLHER